MGVSVHLRLEAFIQTAVSRAVMEVKGRVCGTRPPEHLLCLKDSVFLLAQEGFPHTVTTTSSFPKGIQELPSPAGFTGLVETIRSSAEPRPDLRGSW